MSLLFEAKGLVRDYGELRALDLPEFHLNKGEVVALTGPNGSGKSTLLRILAFLEKPDQGSLVFHGQEKEPRREVTLLLQEPYLLHENVFTNVTMGLRLRKSQKNFSQIYEDVMRAVGFDQPGDFAKRPCRALSGGERQRVALAARLAISPTVLLLDEPTSSVDARSGAFLVKAIHQAMNSGTSVVYASHDPALLDRLGGRQVRMGESLA